MRTTTRALTFAALLAAGSFACQGPRGHAGAQGPRGPSGPPGRPSGGAPHIEDVSPSVGSKRSLVFVVGSNFSDVLVDNEVRFGSLAGDVVGASPTVLQVRTPVGLVPGAAPITVTVHQQTSNAVAFEFAGSGVAVPDPWLASPSAPGAGAALADGRILIPDATGAVLVVENDGTVHALVADALLDGARRLAVSTQLSSAGRVFVFSPSNEGIFSVDPATGSLYAEHFGTPYLSGTFDGSGNLYAIPASADRVDLFAADGTVTPSWGTFSAGDIAEDVQVVGATVYAAVGGTSPGVRKFGVSGGAAVALTAGGVTTIRCLGADGAQLVAGGVFTATSGAEGVVDIDSTGTITLRSAGPFGRVDGVVARSGGIVVSDGGVRGVFVANGTVNVIAGGIAAAQSSLHTAMNSVVSSVYNGPSLPGWVVESWPDGSTQVRAQGQLGELAFEDATHVRVLRRDVKDVASLDLVAGTLTPVFSVSAELTAPVGLSRDPVTGNHFVSGDGKIVSYDSAGTLLNATFATVPGVESLTVDGPVMYASQPTLGAAVKVIVANGSVVPYLNASTGLSAPSFFYRAADNATMRLYVIDSGAGATWLIDAYGFVTPFDLSTPGAGSATQFDDGTVVITGAQGRMLRTP